jgi:hypothetical protein
MDILLNCRLHTVHKKYFIYSISYILKHSFSFKKCLFTNLFDNYPALMGKITNLQIIHYVLVSRFVPTCRILRIIFPLVFRVCCESKKKVCSDQCFRSAFFICAKADPNPALQTTVEPDPDQK